MADNKNATRIEIETHRRGLSSAEIQELSKKEMEKVQGGALNAYFRCVGETQGKFKHIVEEG